jgi:SAM-dependent methyltransferase
VLHHLVDAEEGFRVLSSLLAPGGRLLLYVYSRPERAGARRLGLQGAAGLRRLTVKLPHPLLRLLCAPVAGVLYSLVVVPGQLGARFGVRVLDDLPLRNYHNLHFRSLWLDTFDRLSAPIERRYVWGELQPWFEREGLRVKSVREAGGLFILAEKPR